jgi:hypothetical protein
MELSAGPAIKVSPSGCPHNEIAQLTLFRAKVFAGCLRPLLVPTLFELGATMVSDRQNKGVNFPLLDKVTSKVGTFRRFGHNYSGLPIDTPRNLRFSDVFLLTSISLVLPSLFFVSARYCVNFGSTMARCTVHKLQLEFKEVSK